MIKSMTAFARAEKRTPPYTIRVEARTYNSRYLDVALRLSHGFEPLEEPIKRLIAQNVVRGRLEIRIQIQDESEAAVAYELDLPRARAYYQVLTRLNEALGLSEPVGAQAVLAAGNLVQAKEVQHDTDAVWHLVAACLEQAFGDLDRMRRAEGKHLAQDFAQRLDAIEHTLDQIEAHAQALPTLYQQRLTDRIEALTRGVVEIDPVRIAQEAALLADRSDISEEIVRARSHIQQFRLRMADDKPAGRPLNFLLQEFNREFTTMGSKSGKADLAHLIVAVKSEVEKIREQIQNVE